MIIEFVNPFVVAAFFVSSIMCGFKLQFQALLYFWAVVYAVQDANQFVLVSLLMGAAVMVSKFRAAAAASG